MTGRLAVGIDVGGTKIAAGLVDPSAQIHARHEVRTHAGRPPDEVIAAIAAAAHTVLQPVGLSPHEVDGFGVGFAGHTHGTAGRVLTSSNLPAWNNHPLRDILQAQLQAPVILENDTNCAAWGEYRFGAGRGSRHMCYVTMSTGYGIGIVIDGQLYVGATGTAGELGHAIVDPDGPPCSCGKRGCIMSYASGIAISRMARERIQAGASTLLREWVGDTPDHVSAEQVAQAACQGDAVACDILAVAGRFAGIGLANIVEILNPDRIVLGGGLTKIGPLFLEPCFQALRTNVQPVLVDSAEIRYAALGDDAGVVGAATLVWDRR